VLDINFDINLNLANYYLSETDNEYDNRHSIYKNLKTLYNLICQSDDNINVYRLFNRSCKKYIFNKQSVVNALCEFLSIETENTISTFEEISNFFNTHTDFTFNNMSISINMNYTVSVLELIYLCNILGNKLNIINNLSMSFTNTFGNFSKLTSDIYNNKLLCFNYLTCKYYYCTNIFGVKPFSIDVYTIDQMLGATDAGDDINNYKKITLTHKNVMPNFLDNACIDNTKLYLFKIEFKTNKSGWSTLNPFIINHKDLDKYHIINKLEVFSHIRVINYDNYFSDYDENTNKLIFDILNEDDE
jgi:hypothetical protein